MHAPSWDLNHRYFTFQEKTLSEYMFIWTTYTVTNIICQQLMSWAILQSIRFKTPSGRSLNPMYFCLCYKTCKHHIWSVALLSIVHAHCHKPVLLLMPIRVLNTPFPFPGNGVLITTIPTLLVQSLNGLTILNSPICSVNIACYEHVGHQNLQCMDTYSTYTDTPE